MRKRWTQPPHERGILLFEDFRGPVTTALRCRHNGTEGRDTNRHVHTYVPSSTIHNSQRQKPLKWRKLAHKVKPPCHPLLLGWPGLGFCFTSPRDAALAPCPVPCPIQETETLHSACFSGKAQSRYISTSWRVIKLRNEICLRPVSSFPSQLPSEHHLSLSAPCHQAKRNQATFIRRSF